jgi:retron-type reverse transcriptase
VFEKISAQENLFLAWREFKANKIKKEDVSQFAVDVEEYLFSLSDSLRAGTWQHGPYRGFYVRDPKLRHIHKASVIDRVLHHAIVRILEPVFDQGFIFDSYSSRKTKGTHKAGERFRQFAWKLSRNNLAT